MGGGEMATEAQVRPEATSSPALSLSLSKYEEEENFKKETKTPQMDNIYT